MKIPPIKKPIYIRSISSYNSLLYSENNAERMIDLEGFCLYLDQPKNIESACTKMDTDPDITTRSSSISPHIRETNSSLAFMLEDYYELHVHARYLLDYKAISRQR